MIYLSLFNAAPWILYVLCKCGTAVKSYSLEQYLSTKASYMFTWEKICLLFVASYITCLSLGVVFGRRPRAYCVTYALMGNGEYHLCLALVFLIMDLKIFQSRYMFFHPDFLMHGKQYVLHLNSFSHKSIVHLLQYFNFLKYIKENTECHCEIVFIHLNKNLTLEEFSFFSFGL